MQSKHPSMHERAPPQANLPHRKLSGKGPLRNRWTSARGGITSTEGGVSSRLPPPLHPNPKPSPQPVTEAPDQLKVTATRKTARPKKPQTKSTAGPKPATGKPKKKAAASVKTAAAKPTNPDLVVPTQTSSSTLENISDHPDHLPLQACVELTRRLLTSNSSLPPGAARPRAVLKTVILFVAEYVSTPYEDRTD
jgi:hypothetical protein